MSGNSRKISELPAATSVDAAADLLMLVDVSQEQPDERSRRVTVAQLGASIPATTAAKGVVELATDAEVQAGVDSERAVTPAALQSKLSDSTSTASSTTIASAAAVKAAKDTADAALPKAGGTLSGQLLADDSSNAAAPAIAFDGDPNTGLLRTGADALALVTGGLPRISVGADGAVEIPGNLSVSGTTTTVNTQNLVVADKNIELGSVVSPTDAGADGGGLTLRGSTDKTLTWADSGDQWNSSEHFNLADGKAYRINGVEVLSGTALGASVQISSSNIPNGTISNDDLAGSIADSKLSAITSADKVALSALNIDGGTDIGAALADADLFIVDDGGEGTNRKAAVSRISDYVFGKVTGDITIASNGTAAIGSGVISDGDISASAEIAVSKLADGAARQLLQTDADGSGVEWTSNVDLPGSLDVTGTATFDGAVICAGTGYLDLPAGTDAQRPETPSSGMLRYNTTSASFEGYSAGAWGPIGGTGATVTTSDSPPADPVDGDLWYDSAGGRTYVYYDDGSGAQWVDAAPQGGAGLTAEDIGVSVQGYDADTAKLDVAQTWLAAQTFRQAASQDGILLRGRAGGSGNYSVEIVPAALSDSRTLTAPDVSGTLITTGDTGTVTSAMLAGSIADSKLSTITAAGKVSGGAITSGTIGGSTAIGTSGAIATTGTLAVGQSSAAANTDLDLAGTYAQTVVAVGALQIDCSTGNYFSKSISGDSTFTVANVPASRSYSFVLELTHTSGTITWFSGVIWPGGTAPTLTTGKVHLFVFATSNGGTTWRSSSLINYAS